MNGGRSSRRHQREPLVERALTGKWWRFLAIVLGVVATAAVVSLASGRRGAGATDTSSPRGSFDQSSFAQGSGPPTQLLSPPPDQLASVPRAKHVWLIILENKTFDQLVGVSAAPFLNDLISKSGLATRYQAITHPSQPNYLALFSGSVQGIADDHPHDLNAPTIADQIEAAGLTWHVYAENVPPSCSAVATASGGPDGNGNYARKHEPAISFTSISGDPARCANIGPLNGFDPAAADFSIIVPNLCHDMHDCSVAEGDTWLKSFVPKITGSAAFQDSGVLYITVDEGADGTNPPNRVATIVSSPLVPAGAKSAVPHNHYSLLRTIQSSLGLACLAQSCTANTMGELFVGGSPPPPSTKPKHSVAPSGGAAPSAGASPSG